QETGRKQTRRADVVLVCRHQRHTVHPRRQAPLPNWPGRRKRGRTDSRVNSNGRKTCRPQPPAPAFRFMWQPPSANPIELADGDVHVWRISLARQPAETRAIKRLLSPDEVARAERFYFQRHHDAFVAARAGLRNTL